MTDHRKLAAIFAADAVGYSRLMADDEAATLRSLNEARSLFRERIQAHGGRLIDTAGDSILAEFPIFNRGYLGVELFFISAGSFLNHMKQTSTHRIPIAPFT